jgi:putative acyl-CoA dehydrogenase
MPSAMPPSDYPVSFEDRNLLSASLALSEAVQREGAGSALKRLAGFALMIGSSGTDVLSRRANHYTPQLEAFDRTGRALNRVHYHGPFLDMIERSAAEGLKSPHVVAHPMPTVRQSAHVERAAQIYLAAGADGGHVRALTMANAGLPILEHAGAEGAALHSKVQARGFDGEDAPVERKTAALVAVTLSAPAFPGALAVGVSAGSDHKVSGLIRSVWMPDADAVIALANSSAGPVIAVVSRYRRDGSLNAMSLRPLMPTPGLRSAANADVLCSEAEATLIRSPVALADAILLQRFDGATALAGLLHRALAEAISVSRHESFGALGHRTLTQHTLASMAIDVEAAVALTFRLARAFDRATDARASAWRRLMTPVTSYMIAKISAGLLAEVSDMIGPLALSELSPVPRLLRDGAANLWFDHSSTAMTLDVLHMLQRDPEAIDLVLSDLREASANDDQLLGQYQRVEALLQEPRYLDGRGRMLLENLGLLAAAVLLKAHAPPIIAAAYSALRLGPHASRCYGQGLEWADHEAIVQRIATLD